jgi:hypothetical protein
VPQPEGVEVWESDAEPLAEAHPLEETVTEVECVDDGETVEHSLEVPLGLALTQAVDDREPVSEGLDDGDPEAVAVCDGETVCVVDDESHMDGELQAETREDAEPQPEALALADALPHCVELCVLLTLPEDEWVADEERLDDGEAVEASLPDGDVVCVGDAVPHMDGEVVTEEHCDADPQPETLGLGDALLLCVALLENGGVSDDDPVNDTVGLATAVNEALAEKEGDGVAEEDLDALTEDAGDTDATIEPVAQEEEVWEVVPQQEALAQALDEGDGESEVLRPADRVAEGHNEGLAVLRSVPERGADGDPKGESVVNKEAVMDAVELTVLVIDGEAHAEGKGEAVDEVDTEALLDSSALGEEEGHCDADTVEKDEIDTPPVSLAAPDKLANRVLENDGCGLRDELAQPEGLSESRGETDTERVHVGDFEASGDGVGAPEPLPPPLKVEETDALAETLPHNEGDWETEAEALLGAEAVRSLEALSVADTEEEPLGEKLALGDGEGCAECESPMDSVAAYVVGAAVSEKVLIIEIEELGETDADTAPEREEDGEGEGTALLECAPEEEPVREGEEDSEAHPDADGELVPDNVTAAERECVGRVVTDVEAEGHRVPLREPEPAGEPLPERDGVADAEAQADGERVIVSLEEAEEDRVPTPADGDDLVDAVANDADADREGLPEEDSVTEGLRENVAATETVPEREGVNDTEAQPELVDDSVDVGEREGATEEVVVTVELLLGAAVKLVLNEPLCVGETERDAVALEEADCEREAAPDGDCEPDAVGVPYSAGVAEMQEPVKKAKPFRPFPVGTPPPM